MIENYVIGDIIEGTRSDYEVYNRLSTIFYFYQVAFDTIDTIEKYIHHLNGDIIDDIKKRLNTAREIMIVLKKNFIGTCMAIKNTGWISPEDRILLLKEIGYLSDCLNIVYSYFIFFRECFNREIGNYSFRKNNGKRVNRMVKDIYDELYCVLKRILNDYDSCGCWTMFERKVKVVRIQEL